MDSKNEKAVELTILEVSKIFNIQKSTLRYWESEGLISLDRNPNNYRSYTMTSIYEISDILFYRSLGMPIKSLKNYRDMASEELEILLDENISKVEQQIKDLEETKQRIKFKQKLLDEYKKLLENPYLESQPDFKLLSSFKFTNQEYWEKSTKDLYFTGLFLNETHDELIPGFVVDKEDKQPIEKEILWKDDGKKKRYLTCILEVSYENRQISNLEFHFRNMRKRGFRPGIVLARHLITGFDGERKDYYKAWIEAR